MKKKVTLLPDIDGLFCLVIFVVMVFFAGKRALLDGDTLWHIKAGSIMIDRGEILTHDIFSHTQFGMPWTAHEWLAEIIMGAIHRQCGLSGVVVFYFLLTALTFWLLFKVVKNCGAGDFLSLFVVAISFVLALSHLLARPHIFSWLFGVVTLYLLQKNDRKLFLLPVIMIAWANLHGGFVLGLFLQGIFLTGAFIEAKPWSSRHSWREFLARNSNLLLVLILSTLATGLNPFGFGQLLFPFHVADSFYRQVVAEWFAPDFQELWEFRYYLVFILFVLSFGKAKISWTNRLFLVFFINASLTHVRHISIAALFLVPFHVELFKPWQFRCFGQPKTQDRDNDLELNPASGPLLTILAGFFLFFLGSTNLTVWQNASTQLFPLPEEYSASAIDYLRDHPPKGKMFNYDSLGDYLIYTLGPEQKVFLDGRIDMYSRKTIKDYIKIRELNEECEELLDRYEIGWIIVPNTWALIRYLKKGSGWKESYRDDQLSILVRQTSAGP